MKTSHSLRVATVQFQHKPGDKEYNLKQIHHFIDKAAQQNIQVLVLPEMCITGYWHVPKLPDEQVYLLSETLHDSPSLALIRQRAIELNMLIGVGLIEKGLDGKCYNTWVACMPSGQFHAHRKLHAFEHQSICSGDEYTVFDTPWGVKMGILICWDNNLVENPRANALLGADIILAPHQTGGTRSSSPHSMKPLPLSLWENRHKDPESLRAAFQGEHGRGWLLRWLPSRAHDNGVFYLFSNGVGLDDDEIRTGNAMVIDPYGRIIAESNAIEDDMVIANLDLDLLPMSTGRRWLTGRRPELYRILTQTMGYERDARSVRFATQAVNITQKR
ncbi:nitrilase family protein [Providencia heimbachae]|uniref:Nitrilase n=1 Tax=Providencia heimbachae ATCC 35613 TaxID=1354272 RepID=A0A1B7JWD0_9GAMM|nr:nitrilase family protein [Providencia heimbachae]OAT52211.1 nitrilase [Providencia heimbachae ATCC 35613]SQH15011.1 (R)-stereoselective amidase [Providencia heimbachae]